jgi:predicted dehydrogenase
MKIKTLIIGLGKIGFDYDFKKNFYLSHFKSFYKNKNFEIVGVCDKNLKKQDFLKKKKIPFFFDFKKAIEKLNPSLVVVATPTSSHIKILKYLLKFKDIKFILCEKPLGNNLIQAEKIKKLKNSNKIFVNYMRSADKIFENEIIKKIDKKNHLYRDIFYKGSLDNNACHYLHLLNKYFKNYKSIKNIKKFNNDQFDFDINYGARVKARFLSSCSRNLTLDTMRFMNRNNMFHYENGGHIIYNFTNIDNPVYSTKNYFKLKKTIKNKFYENSQKYVVENILNFFLNKKYYLCNLPEAIKIHKIVSIVKNEK